MAVDDFLSRDTDAFVLPSKSFYPTKIPIAHYQLRHFISSPEPDVVYYASGCDIFCLNAATQTQAHVATLPFEARCTAAGCGFVCVGGADHGNFAAIKVAGFPPVDDSGAEFETRLSRPPLLATARRIQLEKIGEDIVNSISIHTLPATAGDGRDDVVAVLTNNDRSVRLYSLLHNLELCCIDLPIAMNHATISPDGSFLVAVGDQQTGFFFERHLPAPDRPSSWKEPSDRLRSVPSEWKLFEEVALYIPLSPCAQGYFTTAWSPSGRLCAVGSECGYITVFDMDHLKVVEDGEDAILGVISSTRPDANAGPGAVRTMLFSPAPSDFLIWSEDQGRVCVADLRCALKVKQILTLDPKADGLERIEVADFDLSLPPDMSDVRREADFIRRYRRTLDAEGIQAAVDTANEYFEADSERQRALRRLGVVESDDDPHGLSSEERRILETLRTSRHTLEARQPGGIRPRSINYTTASHVEAARYDGHERTRLGSRADVVLRDRAAAARDVPSDPLDDLLSESLRSTNRYLGERTAPRRQASIVVSINEGTVNAPAHAQTNITDAVTTRSPNTISAHTRSEIISSTDNAWRTIQAALASQASSAARASTSNPAASSSQPTAPELRSELRRLRQLTQVRERLRTERASQLSTEAYEFSVGLRRVIRSTHNPSYGLRTAGLAISQDGRTLYCGTEEGIFEFKMNVHARKGFPAITLR
ncbi:uncharacterized protein M421DRAFT_424059 [Didymella exigua CBS 183.55]|uniref:DUF2415 domain-containing protein n=1 Tax=Didymella exigua CBS 183.55 TaxID=1150837 RepID=A0A6A5RI34_9PLEO|nr:uncharacterized protein M421DRAFT_424059 [Didymella exigua CBS 183.55]KAF1925257.1 hypothetical protein M421DRAFT_424059 [Didymella exigua CBS 183.55]